MNLVANGSFENGLAGWQLLVDEDGQAAANLALDSLVMAGWKYPSPAIYM